MTKVITEFKCKICNKNYASYQSLWIHNKKFHKPICKNIGKELDNKSQDVHNESKDSKDLNPDQKKYICKYCNKIYKHKQTKWTHEKKCINTITNDISVINKQEISSNFIVVNKYQKTNNDNPLEKHSNDIIINKKLDIINTNINKIKENIPINNQLINIIMDKNKALDELNDKIENTITVSENKPVISDIQPTLTLNDVVVVSRPTDNYINATQLCKAGNKNFAHWYRLDSTKELINKLIEIETEPDMRYRTSGPVSIIQINKGGNDKNNQDTWIHPHIAIQLAQWLSPLFALQVSKWVLQLFTYGHVEINKLLNDKEKEIKLANQRIRRIKKALLFYASYC